MSRADPEKRMTLRQHLEELRSCLFRAMIVFVLLFAAGVVYTEPLIRVALRPWEQVRAQMVEAGFADPGPLSMLAPAESFVFGLKVALYFALLAGAPIYLWQAWRFVGAGLLAKERRAVYLVFPPALLLLLAGLSFSFLVLLPMTLYFFMTWLSPELVEVGLRMSEYLALVTSMSLLMGGIFQLPLLMWAVVRAGLLSVKTLSKSRRVSTLVILIFAAVVTPPDVISCLGVAAPMIALYEVGLLLARHAEKQRQR